MPHHACMCMRQVLMPHLVRWTHYSLFVAVYRVEGLPNMDDYGSTVSREGMRLKPGLRRRLQDEAGAEAGDEDKDG